MAETRRYWLVGCQTRLVLWGAVLRVGLDALHVRHEIRIARVDEAEDLRSLVGQLRDGHAHGIRICGSHGHDVLDYVDEPEFRTRQAQVVDTLVLERGNRVVARSADAIGICEAMKEHGIRPNTALIIGAGTTAMGAAAACESLGARVVGTTTRSWTSTEALHSSTAANQVRRAGLLTMLWPAPNAPAAERTHLSVALLLQFTDFARSADVFFEATPPVADRGFESDTIRQAIPWSKLGDASAFVDLACRHEPSPLQRTALQQGLSIILGVEVLVEQVAKTIEIWTGLQPPRAALEAAAQRASLELGA